MHRNITDEIFRDLPPYVEYFAYKPTLFYYGKAVDNQLSVFEKAYHKAKDTLGVIGNKLDSEEEISADTQLMDKWNEVKKNCPEFY